MFLRKRVGKLEFSVANNCSEKSRNERESSGSIRLKYVFETSKRRIEPEGKTYLKQSERLTFLIDVKSDLNKRK